MLDAYGWPLQCRGAVGVATNGGASAASDGFPTNPIHPLPLIADILISLALIASTAFVVGRWIHRVEQNIPMRPIAILVGVVVVCTLIWVLDHDDSFRPDWYDYPSWLLGIAGMIYTIPLLMVRGVVWSIKCLCRWSGVCT